jgi:predicted DNA-binding transcriptional regulator YafY
MNELEALHLAVAILGEATDPELSKSAQSLAAKIDAVLPENADPPSTGWGFAVYPFADAAAGFKHMPLLRDAVREKKLIRMTYLSLDEQLSTRMIRPLQLEYWGRVWTMTAWCELREDFRVFRVDRIESLIDTGARFKDEVGKTLSDYLAQLATEKPKTDV